MQDINHGEDVGLIPADQLREMTISEDDLKLRMKNGIIQNLMESMVKVATANGAKEYQTGIQPDFDQKLLTDIQSEFEKIGYKTLVSNTKFNGQDALNLVISWNENNVSDRSEEQ